MKKNLFGPTKCVLACAAVMMLIGNTAAYAEKNGSAVYQEEPPFIPPQVYISGDYSYIINEDETITISEYTGEQQEITVPAKIDGYAVSAIGSESFAYTEMKSLTVPEEIGEIQSRAFEYCVISDSLELPADISIRNDAFSYVYLPRVVWLPEGARVSFDAFSYNEAAEILIVGPRAVLQDSSFGYSENLKTVVCAAGAVLKEDAFEYCDALEQVILCGDVSVHEEAFSYCDNVKVTRAGEKDFAPILAGLLTEEPGTQASEPMQEGPDAQEMHELRLPDTFPWGMPADEIFDALGISPSEAESDVYGETAAYRIPVRFAGCHGTLEAAFIGDIPYYFEASFREDGSAGTLEKILGELTGIYGAPNSGDDALALELFDAYGIPIEDPDEFNAAERYVWGLPDGETVLMAGYEYGQYGVYVTAMHRGMLS